MLYRRARIAGASYFFTVVTHERRPIFRNAEAVALFQGGLSRIKHQHPFDIDAYVILPDHMHYIWTLPDGDSEFSTRWRLIKEAFTKPFVRQQQPLERSASRLAKREQPVWQRRFWEHVIRDDDDYATHVDYIHYNPVRHELVAAARDWRYSSFGEWVERGIYNANWGSGDMLPTLEWAALAE